MEVLSPEVIEPIIFKLSSQKEKYANLLTEYFKKHWFENPVIGDMTEILIKYYSEYNKLPKEKTISLIVDKKFKENKDEAQNIVKSALEIDLTEYDEDYLDNQVVDYLKQAGLYHTIMESIDEIEKSHKVSCIDNLEKIASMSFNNDLGFDYFEDHEQHVETLSNPESKITSGWKSIDLVTNGGWPKDGRCIVTFVAETGMGKSLIMSNMAATYVKQGLFPLIISLEMSETIYGTRIDSHLSKLTLNTLRDNLDLLTNKISGLKKKNKDSKLIIKEYPPESITSAHIKTYAENVIRTVGRKPDVIIVDYINLVLPNGVSNSDNSYARIGKVTRDLRALSYFFNCPVISATQANRDAYNAGSPALDNISESMGIAHVSDFIASLYQLEGEREEGIINMCILKNRLGGLIGKNIAFDINYNNLIISDQDDTDSLSDTDVDDIFKEIKDNAKKDIFKDEDTIDIDEI